MKNKLQENMRRFGTKNLHEDWGDEEYFAGRRLDPVAFVLDSVNDLCKKLESMHELNSDKFDSLNNPSKTSPTKEELITRKKVALGIMKQINDAIDSYKSETKVVYTDKNIDGKPWY